ncbi:hypothetical protein M8494_07730 [Serratia ureilytica]
MNNANRPSGKKSLKTALEQQRPKPPRRRVNFSNSWRSYRKKQDANRAGEGIGAAAGNGGGGSENQRCNWRKRRSRQKNALALADANQTQQALREELDGLRSRAKWLPDAQALGKKPAQQSYAAGVALGRDIQTMLAERKMGHQSR